MSNNLNDVKTEAQEVYDSIEKIQSALADAKITTDEAIEKIHSALADDKITLAEATDFLKTLNTLSTELPVLAHEGKELINNIEKEVEKDLVDVQESRFFKALSALRAEPSMANFAKLLYSIVEHFFPSEQSSSAVSTATQPTDTAAESSTAPQDKADAVTVTPPALAPSPEPTPLVADHVETVSDTTTA